MAGCSVGAARQENPTTDTGFSGNPEPCAAAYDERWTGPQVHGSW